MAGIQWHVMPFVKNCWQSVPYNYRITLILTSCTAMVLTPFAWKRLTYNPELLPPPPKDFIYCLRSVNDYSSVITLADGRKIGYAQYGDQNGKAVIILHGIPGSRLENALFDDNAKDLGIRIIGIDRPGIGWSSPDPRPLKERKVLDHAKDVEALAEHLRLDSYAVIGVSGGGPYALACARALPSSPSKPRLNAVSVVTGLGLPDMSQAYPAFLVFLNRHLNLRWLLKWLFTSGPVWNLQLPEEERMEAMRKSFDLKKAHPADIETARNPKYPDWQLLFLRSSREAMSQGWEGFLDDSAVLCADPGFRVEQIPADLPVQLWYGTDDTNVSPKAGYETAQRLRAGGNSKVKLHMEEGGTHGSVQVKCQRRILEDLLAAMDA